MRAFARMIGEGFHGKTYHLEALPLHGEKVTSIVLYTADKTNILLKGSDLEEFLAFLSKTRGIIAKVFKSQFLITGSTVHRDFMEELDANERILTAYKNNLKFLTITPVTGFRKLRIVGMELISDTGSKYVVFSTMCKNVFTARDVTPLKEIMESIVVLQKSGYQHNDIKFDNIVKCDDRFKLIDWGQASPIDEIYIGDMICTSPVKWYLMGAPSYFADKFMDVRAITIDKDYEASPPFREQEERIRNEFFAVLGRSQEKEKLMQKYKKTFDIFMAGMTFLQIIHKFGLSYKKYKPLIEALTSLEKPISDPVEALRLIKGYM